MTRIREEEEDEIENRLKTNSWSCVVVFTSCELEKKFVVPLITNMADEADKLKILIIIIQQLIRRRNMSNIVYYIKCCIIRYSSMCNLIVSYLKAHYDYDLAHKYGRLWENMFSDWCSNFDQSINQSKVNLYSASSIKNSQTRHLHISTLKQPCLKSTLELFPGNVTAS